MAGLRHDSIYNKLDDDLATTELDLSGSRSFSKTTARIGLASNPTPSFGAYASWGPGFLPPATEELSRNPDRFGGFNNHLVPATSRGPEVGVRDAAGQVESVAYHEMPAMLLNELQKQHATIQAQQAQIAELRRIVQVLMDERITAKGRETGGN